MTGTAPRFSHRTPLMPGDEVGTWAREALLRMDADFCLALTAAIHRSENTGAQYRFKTAFAGFDNCSLAAQPSTQGDRVCATPVLAAGEEWDVWHTQCSELAKLQVSVTGDVRSKKGPMRFCAQPIVTAVAEDYAWTNPLTRSIFRRNSKTRQRWFDDCLANVLQTGTLIFAVWRLEPFRSACRVPSPLTHCVN